MNKYGPVELMKNLKNTKFIQKYGKINVSENMFEFPYAAQKTYKDESI